MTTAKRPYIAMQRLLRLMKGNTDVSSFQKMVQLRNDIAAVKAGCRPNVILGEMPCGV
jgi:hypothetical protein